GFNSWVNPGEFDAIHASPPCHDHSALAAIAGRDGSGHLLQSTLDLLDRADLPWVCENVVGSKLRTTLRLCGSIFGLGVWRHRDFASSQLIMGRPSCRHD